MSLLETMNEGIKDAMRNKNALRLDTLRMMKSMILAVDARGNIPDAEVIKLFKNYLKSLEEALEQTKIAKREEAVEKLEKEILVVKEFIPASLSKEDTEKLVKKAIEESGAKSKKDIGLVMKIIKAANLEVDGKLAKETIDRLLAD